MDSRSDVEVLIENNKFDKGTIDKLIVELTSSDQGMSDICKIAILNLREEMAIYAAKKLVNYLDSEEFGLRSLVSEILIQYGSYSIEAILPLLKSEKSNVLIYAVDLLGVVGNESVCKELTGLLRHSNSNVVMSVIESIGNLNCSGAFDELINLYEKSNEFCPAIINSLGKIGGEDAENFLVSIIKNEDYFLKVLAIDALGNCSENIEISKQLLGDLVSYSKDIQLILLKTIYAISYRCDVDLMLPEDCREIAYRAISDNDDDVKMSGLAALGNEFIENDVEYLISLIEMNKSEIQQWILFNLVNYNDGAMRVLLFEKYFSERRENVIDFIGNILLIIEDLDVEELEDFKVRLREIIIGNNIDDKETLLEFLN